MNRQRSSKQDQRRKNARVPASFPILFEWNNQQGELCRTRGATQDFSAGGVYNYLEQPLPPNVAVIFHTIFPAQMVAGEPQKLRCSGRVLRSERLGGSHFGVAVTIETREPVNDSAGESNRRVNRRIMPFSSIPVAYPAMKPVVRDLSPTGAFIEDKRPLPVGWRLDVTLAGNAVMSEVTVKAIVRRSEPQVGMAVEFESISKGFSSQLKDMVTRSPRR